MRTTVKAEADAAEKVPEPEPEPESEEPSALSVGVGVPVAFLALSAAAIGSGAAEGPLKAYITAVGVPALDTMTGLGLSPGIMEFVTHWFHALNMGIVLGAMGGYGTYLGYRIKAGYGSEATFGTPDTAAELHWKLMTAMGLFFLAGGQGGLLFALTRPDTEFLESPHAITAFAGLGVLAAQGILGSTMKGNKQLRNVHAVLGTSLMALFTIHAGLGIQLGLSMSDLSSL